jgi:hypothetical protein
MRHSILAFGLLIGLGVAGLAQPPETTRPAKELLTPDSFAQLHALIQPEVGEFRWDEIHWLASIWHARKQGAAEDKPILVFGTAGAGFNDPLGNC